MNSSTSAVVAGHGNEGAISVEQNPPRKVNRKQKVQGKELNVENAVEHLTKAKEALSRKRWWDSLQVIVHEELDLEANEKYSVVKLRCIHCSALFSASNPSARAASHFELSNSLFVCRRAPGTPSSRTLSYTMHVNSVFRVSISMNMHGHVDSRRHK